jgi:hypothetical protein
MKVAIGNISPGQVDTAFFQSVVNALVTGTVTGGVICKSGPYLDDNRNDVCLAFLDQTDADALLFIDSDVQFEPDDITRLVKATEQTTTLDVVAGWYMSPSARIQGPWPVVFRWVDTEHGPELQNIPETILTDAEDELLSVASIGAGFILIQRPLLERLRELTPRGCPFFTEPVVDGVHYGEDHGFCWRVTDPRVGGRIMVDPHVRVRHHKKVIL